MKMKSIFVILLFPLALFSQSHYNLKIEGIDTVSENIVRKMRYPSEFNDSLSVILVLKNIVENIRNEGFMSATFDDIHKDSSSFLTTFSLGQKFNSGKIRLESIPETALAFAGLKNKKGGVDIIEFLKKRDLIITFFENNGYPFASINLDSIIQLENGINAIAKVATNNLFTVSSFIPTGYTKINIEYLLSHTNIKLGKSYDESIIKSIPEAINELSFVEIVGKPTLYFKENNTVQIVCELRKKSANQFDGLIGFAPDPQNSFKLLITGKVSVNLNNILNYGELINLDWQKMDATSQKLTAGYDVKYLLKSRFGSVSNISILKQDSTYLNTDIMTTIPYYFTYNKLIKIYFEKKSSTLLDQSYIKDATTLPDFADISKTSFGAGVKLWKLDYAFNPQKGYLLDVTAGSGTKTIDKNPVANQDIYKNVNLKTKHIEMKGMVSVFIPMTKRTALMIEDKSALMQSSSLFINELYKIGGAKSLRGFDENSIPCSRYSILNIEYRFIFQKSSNLFIFFNGAYYENKVSITIHDTPYGFGLGLNIRNKSNIFSISYAYGSQFGNPIAFNAAKIHFGYVTVF